jgi:hypothetical protein
MNDDALSAREAITPLTAANEILHAYNSLAQKLREGAQRFRRTVGWPNGSREVTVYWHEQHYF